MLEGDGGRTTPPRVLLTLPDRPWPVDGGKRRRAAATLHALTGAGLQVDVLVIAAGGPSDGFLGPGADVGRAALVDPGLRPRLGGLAASALRAVPWQVGVIRWGSVRRTLRLWTRDPYDLVWFGSLDHALSLQAIARGSRVVIDLDDVETAKARAYLALPAGLRSTGRAKRLQRRVELPLWDRAQRRALRMADAVLVCSELDRRRLGGARHVHVVPNGYPAEGTRQRVRASASTSTVLLVGTYSYAPNADAAHYAATEVLPALRRLVPDARLRIVGRDADLLPAEVGQVAGVDLVGPVPDMAPELARADVALAPIRFGGGTRVKILEAFAHGVPVVSTPLGCEGLDAEDGEHLLVRADAEALADGCAQLLTDVDLAQRIGSAGHRLLQERFQPQHVDEALREALRTVLAPSPRP